MPNVAEAKAEYARIQELLKRPFEEIFEDDASRRILRDAARNLSHAAETPGDSMHRIGNSSLHLPLSKIGTDKKLFDLMVEHGKPISNGELAQKTGIDPAFQIRLLRFYQSHNYISQVGDNLFAPNNSTLGLSGIYSTGVEFFHTIFAKPNMAFPNFMKKTNYKNPEDARETPWHMAYETTEETAIPYTWIYNQPYERDLFIRYMATQKTGINLWVDNFPFEQDISRGTTTDETPLFIDIGGSGGHVCVSLKEKYPSIPGRVILQDRPEVIEQASFKLNIEKMAHDFWTVNPIKGARAYYLRQVMHNWTDIKCAEILKAIVPAMTEDSLILIDEVVVPEKGASWRSTQLDMAMLISCASVERTEKHWQHVADLAGLDIVKIHKYAEESGDSIIALRPKKA